MTRSDRIIGTIRTATPGAIAWFLGWLVTKIPAVADYLAIINQFLEDNGFVGQTVEGLLTAVVIGLLIGAYYYLVRVIGKRWPMAERWLLGSSKMPAYFKPADAATVTGSIEEPEYRDAHKTAGSSVVVEERTHPTH